MVSEGQREQTEHRFIAIERTVLSQEIAKRILTFIHGGQIQPGEKLPPERELANLLGVSRPSVREALRALQLMNIIEVRPGDGTYVSSLEPQKLAEPLEQILRLLQDVSYIEVLETRRILESAIAELAAERISEDYLERLTACIEKAEATVEEPKAFSEADIELHSLIVESTNNPLLMSLYGSIAHLGIATRERTANIRGVRERTLAYHKKIVQALRDRDPIQSREAMQAHLLDVEEALLGNIDEIGADDQLSI
jgi:GntR family transcriptional repressor for pyruvate dehydrogenase complex